MHKVFICTIDINKQTQTIKQMKYSCAYLVWAGCLNEISTLVNPSNDIRTNVHRIRHKKPEKPNLSVRSFHYFTMITIYINKKLYLVVIICKQVDVSTDYGFILKIGTGKQIQMARQYLEWSSGKEACWQTHTLNQTNLSPIWIGLILHGDMG